MSTNNYTYTISEPSAKKAKTEPSDRQNHPLTTMKAKKALYVVAKNFQTDALAELKTLQAWNEEKRESLVEDLAEFIELAGDAWGDVDGPRSIDDLLSINELSSSETRALQPSELQSLQIVSSKAPLRALAPLGAARAEKMNLKRADKVLREIWQDRIDPMGRIQDHYQDMYDLAMATGYDDYDPPEPYNHWIHR